MNCVFNTYPINTCKEPSSRLVIFPGVYAAAALSLSSSGVTLNVNNLCINWR
jgi:hypothetical protein